MRTAGSRPARTTPPAAALAAAGHVLRRTAHPEAAVALRLLAVGRTAESPAAELAPGLPAVLRLVDLERPATEILPVQLLDGGLRLVLVVDVDEGKAARPAGLLVGDDLHRADGAVAARDQVLDLRFRRVE